MTGGTKPEYPAWRADYDRKQYYRKRNLRRRPTKYSGILFLAKIKYVRLSFRITNLYVDSFREIV